MRLVKILKHFKIVDQDDPGPEKYTA